MFPNIKLRKRRGTQITASGTYASASVVASEPLLGRAWRTSQQVASPPPIIPRPFFLPYQRATLKSIKRPQSKEEPEGALDDELLGEDEDDDGGDDFELWEPPPRKVAVSIVGFAETGSEEGASAGARKPRTAEGANSAFRPRADTGTGNAERDESIAEGAPENGGMTSDTKRPRPGMKGGRGRFNAPAERFARTCLTSAGGSSGRFRSPASTAAAS